MAYVYVKPVMIKCQRCRGCGEVELTGENLTTYQKLARMPGQEVTGVDVATYFGIEPTAANNRLAQLEAFGLLTSRRWGTKRYYQVPVKKKGRKKK